MVNALNITNEMFEYLMSLKKTFDGEKIKLPLRGEKARFNVTSLNKKEKFILDTDRSGYIEIKTKLQNRYSNNQILVRLEINSRPHTNPDGTTTSRNHIHIYKEGYSISWAYDLDKINNELCSSLENFNEVFIYFCKYCNIEMKKDFQLVI